MDPLWSRTGNELVYRSVPQSVQINRVSYTVTGDTFEAKRPQVWLAKIAPGGPMMLAGLSADGKRVLMIVPIEQPKPLTRRPSRSTQWCSSRTSSTI